MTLARAGVHAVGSHRAPKVARRYLCTGMVSWDGELVSSVFVGFAYENHHLRVVIRPQVLGPVHPAAAAARKQAAKTGWRFHLEAFAFAGADSIAAMWHVIRPRPGRLRRPEEDRGQPVVSLREVYSRRHVDDMHQYDDARRYISMMEGRIFASVNNFLVDHNVDIRDYQNQVTVVLNNAIVNHSGVVNTGQMNGVQNQPGAVGSAQSAGGS
ncbi:hypothetical protein GXW82_32940 [Streptacidiphilus sp. 4-A2]|nr:hypothetical protein [Streptacidiphilus sp. 4-A2]